MRCAYHTFICLSMWIFPFCCVNRTFATLAAKTIFVDFFSPVSCVCHFIASRVANFLIWELKRATHQCCHNHKRWHNSLILLTKWYLNPKTTRPPTPLMRRLTLHFQWWKISQHFDYDHVLRYSNSSRYRATVELNKNRHIYG